MRQLFNILVGAMCCTAAGCTRRNLLLSDVASQVVADGREHRIVVIEGEDPVDVRVDSLPAGTFRLESAGGRHAEVYLRSPVRSGELSVRIHAGRTARTLHLSLTPDTVVTTDGTPDWMRLHSPADREAFRRWFTVVADRTSDQTPSELPAEVTDCASLLRYAYREALRAHDDRWYARFPAASSPALPSVQQWTYPNSPLGPNLFRTRPGPFHSSDVADGTFAQFADAKTLHLDNAYLLRRDLRSAKPGDLLFYRVLETDSQYHSMIITGEHGEWVVYNTGRDHGHHGEMRRVLLADLLHHPDPQWRPESANPNWLGVYRWNILREE